MWASVVPPPSSVHLSNPGLATGNVSLNEDVPDPRFSVSSRFDTPLLPIDPCLINVLYFMTEIAYGDFTQRHQPKTYSVPGYDEVEIVTGTAMTARFLFWDTWLAIEYMMNVIDFMMDSGRLGGNRQYSAQSRSRHPPIN